MADSSSLDHVPADNLKNRFTVFEAGFYSEENALYLVSNENAVSHYMHTTSLLINEKYDIHKTRPRYIAHFNDNRRPMPPSWALLVLHVYSIIFGCH